MLIYPLNQSDFWRRPEGGRPVLLLEKRWFLSYTLYSSCFTYVHPVDRQSSNGTHRLVTETLSPVAFIMCWLKQYLVPGKTEKKCLSIKFEFCDSLQIGRNKREAADFFQIKRILVYLLQYINVTVYPATPHVLAQTRGFKALWNVGFGPSTDAPTASQGRSFARSVPQLHQL